MVHPVRPVGESPCGVYFLVLDATLALRWRLASLGRIYIPWHRLALVWALLDRGDAAACARRAPIPWPIGPPNLPADSACPTDSTSRLDATCHDASPHLDRWQPWPARPPLTDETDRWWPSHQLPPIPSPPQPPGDPIRPVPEFPLYPPHAGLLNAWA